MINIPNTITEDRDKLAFLYRAVELLRQEHNQRGKEFIEKTMTEKEWKSYVKNRFNPKSQGLFLIINQLKEANGMTKEILEEEKIQANKENSVKRLGKVASEYDKDINLEEI